MIATLVIGLIAEMIWALIMFRVCWRKGQQEGIAYGIHRMLHELTVGSGESVDVVKRLGWVKTP